jgi:hypothetical protein
VECARKALRSSSRDADQALRLLGNHEDAEDALQENAFSVPNLPRSKDVAVFHLLTRIVITLR